ncbi:PHM/PNGase F domain-containing protein [Chytridium lagenaria]|nr:PHM/PNGase F domain-containing protein [Chytridium lagenaria]
MLHKTPQIHFPELQTPFTKLRSPLVSIPDNTTITFGVDVDVPSTSKKWIAFGLSEMGGMTGADIYILRQYENSSYYMQDSFSASFSTPTVDASQDVTLILPPEPSDTFTVFTFRRPVVSCDSNDLSIERDARVPVIWAFGDSSRGISKHAMSDRGSSEVILWDVTATLSTPPPPSNLRSIDYHAIKYEGLAMSNLVHHIIIYGCSAPPSPPSFFGDLYPCESMDPSCNEFSFSWVPGAPPNSLPAEAGIAFGTGPGASRYFAMQVHYDNPLLIPDRVDASGIRIFYTDQLRQHDVGTLTLGSIRISIPGNSNRPTVLPPNLCPSSCTKRFPGNLTIISQGVHMHQLGLNQTVRHIRNDTFEIAPVVTRRYYDFNFQGSIPVLDKSTTTLIPGDALLTTCAYKPTLGERSFTTTFGESTDNEMCFNFVQYYPKHTPIDFCLTYDLGLAACTSRSRLIDAGIMHRNATSPPLATAVQNLLMTQDLVISAQPIFTPYQPVCMPSVVPPLVNVSVPVVNSTTTTTTTMTTVGVEGLNPGSAVPSPVRSGSQMLKAGVLCIIIAVLNSLLVI